MILDFFIDGYGHSKKFLDVSKMITVTQKGFWITSDDSGRFKNDYDHLKMILNISEDTKSLKEDSGNVMEIITMAQRWFWKT